MAERAPDWPWSVDALGEDAYAVCATIPRTCVVELIPGQPVAVKDWVAVQIAAQRERPAGPPEVDAAISRLVDASQLCEPIDSGYGPHHDGETIRVHNRAQAELIQQLAYLLDFHHRKTCPRHEAFAEGEGAADPISEGFLPREIRQALSQLENEEHNLMRPIVTAQANRIAELVAHGLTERERVTRLEISLMESKESTRQAKREALEWALVRIVPFYAHAVAIQIKNIIYAEIERLLGEGKP